jgi:predicted nuclease of predicted toxin-antitoxin system
MNESNLKFLIDVGVGKGVERFLAEEYDVKAVRDIDPRMEDVEIIRLAVSENRIIITMDKDFGELVYHSSMQHKGVLLLRLENAPGTEKLKIVKDILKKHKAGICNNFSVFHKNKIRIRKINR